MKNKTHSMRPQDIVVLLKILILEDKAWTQVSLANALFMSQSEISESLSRSKYARLLYNKSKQVSRQALMDLLQYGLPYMFPQQLGAVVRGIPTAHSTLPLSEHIQSSEAYVWPYAKGYVRGQAIQPLYPSVIQAVELDSELYENLALIDAIRVGKVREKNLAIEILKQRIC
ncbi:MAG: hypothetical protein R2728_00700 [Chitinophagales bacterium]